MKIDTSLWKPFSFDAIFDVKKGFYNKKPESSSGGTIPFLGATDSDNGVTEYYSKTDLEAASKTGSGNNEPLEEKIFPGHAVCVTNDGSVGYAYYQEHEFTCSHSVNPLYRKDGQFNYLTGLFIATVIMHDRYRWGYGRKWRPERMVKSQLRLPVLCDESGNALVDDEKKYSPDGYTPDWQWMEDYMKSLHCGKITTKIKKTDREKIQTEDWKPFFLHRIFDARMGNGIDGISTSNDQPKYNYISRGSTNNGVVDVVDEIEGETPFPEGSMTLALGGSLGCCFIQTRKFYTAQNVAILTEKVPLSDYVKLFISTLISRECKIKYQAFGRELNAHFRKDFTIKLPVLKDENGKVVIDNDKRFSDDGYIPDWQWMESYMKTLPYSDRLADQNHTG